MNRTDGYEINVAKIRKPSDAYGTYGKHYCRIELPDTSEAAALAKLNELREMFGNGYELTLTHWVCRGERYPEGSWGYRTHNPTESELRKILDVEEKVSGYGMTSNADEAIAVIAYCITHGIQSDVKVVDIYGASFYKISFKDVTISQRDVIMKASCMKGEK